MVKESVILQTNFPKLKLLKRGKVRDIYEIDEFLLIVATDRISAFDVVLPDGIPFKGKVLTQISNFWFDKMKDITSNHLVAIDVRDFPKVCYEYVDVLDKRSILVKKTKPLPVECVVRGYISGSGWNEYQKTKSVCGIKLPEGLLESSKLPKPIFTPSTKADVGHDENITFETVESMIEKDSARKVKEKSLEIYKRAQQISEEKGIIIADTKFEFGRLSDDLILIDEVLTPDSSRFWPMDEYKPGGAQKSFDKQFVRDYLLSIKWDKKPPGPKLPEEVIATTSKKYLEALEKIAGIKINND
jgi:phosphoribosylaminoimidazole-succinocarboxamide synthase